MMYPTSTAGCIADTCPTLVRHRCRQNIPLWVLTSVDFFNLFEGLYAGGADLTPEFCHVLAIFSRPMTDQLSYTKKKNSPERPLESNKASSLTDGTGGIME